MQAAKKQTYEVYRWDGRDWVPLAWASDGQPFRYDTYADALLYCRRRLKEQPGDYLIRGEDGREWPVK
jgi:hypothetical protein